MPKEHYALQTVQLKSATTAPTTLTANTRLRFDSLIYTVELFTNFLETLHCLLRPLIQQANLPRNEKI